MKGNPHHHILAFFLSVASFSRVTTLPAFHVQDDGNSDASDSGLYNFGLYQGDIVKRRARMAETHLVPANVWEQGVVIYRVDDKIGCPESRQCDLLMRAISHYHTYSCVRFQEWTGETNYVYIFLNPSSGECWSAVGRTGGQQLLSLGRRCWYQGIIIHELGHSIGLWHEMNRPDRDRYITINWSNILSGFARAFDKQSTQEYVNLDGDFDLTSIMMYDEYAFSKDKHSPTIKANDNSVIGPIWKKSGLSAIDIRRIGIMYGCATDTPDTPTATLSPQPTSSFPYGITCSFDKHTCGFRSSGQVPWRWHRINQSEGYVYHAVEALSSQTHKENETSLEDKTGYFISVNFFGISKENVKESQMGCLRFWHLLRGEKDAYLRVRQSYLSHTTQLAVLPEDTYDLWEAATATPVHNWFRVQLPLNVTVPFKLIFESSPGEHKNGLVALDDLQLQFSPCSRVL